MKNSPFPYKDVSFITFRDPDPSGDGSSPSLYETVWVRSKGPSIDGGIEYVVSKVRDTFEQMARADEEWDCLTSLVEKAMKKSHVVWGWACSEGTIDIPF